ncbi:MAG: hypothetical protein H0V82_00565 [Candidatus Protochlamydia sp.]|nr:hypothetical protein [Candidatus Protochlamydia sp.]
MQLNSGSAQIFLGYLLQGEISVNLSQMTAEKKQQWQLSNPFKKAYLKEKEYFGFFMPNGTTYEEIKAKEAALKMELEYFCPKFSFDKNKIFIFPQTFIS